jgi:hypothetical protein
MMLLLLRDRWLGFHGLVVIMLVVDYERHGIGVGCERNPRDWGS